MSPSPIRFGAVPGRNLFTLTQTMKPMLGYLQSVLGREVKLSSAITYSQVLEGMRHDRYDMVLLGPELYVRARRAGLPFEAAVKPVRYGRGDYRGMIIARKDSGIVNLSDLRGRSMAFVDRDSGSGYTFPRAMLELAGLGDDVLGPQRFSGTHDQVVFDVLRGDADAGACYEDARPPALRRTPERVDELMIVARTLPLSNEPIALSERLDPITRTVLTRALLNMHQSEPGREALAALGPEFDRYMEVRDGDYASVETYMRATRARAS